MKIICCTIFYFFILSIAFAQKPSTIHLTKEENNNRINITVDSKPFTSFIFPDSLEKPVLYPIIAANDEIITRGFPIAPRANEPVDHPHHIGLWLNYENVNGLDFWNNSSAIPAEKKSKYGWIKDTKVLKTKSGKKGLLQYSANWKDISGNILLTENTTFEFSASYNLRIFDRTTTLTAAQDVALPDIKDGFLGLRVAHELELPTKEEKEFKDDKGNVTKIKASDNTPNGNYITSEGITGEAAWATRAKWCMLYGKKGNDTISIVIIDHPKNIGYPTYWHARGYGLFAANPLGQKIFSNGKETLNFSLKKGEAVTFRYRIVINAGKERLANYAIEKLTNGFWKEVKHPINPAD